MATSNVCWGIEIGAAAIKAIKLEAVGEGRCRVLEYAVIQHPKVLSTPGVDVNDVLRVSLGALTSQYDLTKAAVAVSVPGHSAFARFAKLPPVEPKKVPDIVKFEAMQQIPFPLEQVEWDYQTFVSPDSPDVEVGIFAITRERVAERLQMLEDVGIVPNYVILSPIAVYNALAYDLDFGPQTPGTIVVDVGTTSTDLVIATPGRMWVRTFPIGGHQFTEAIVNQFQISYPKAEKIKREAEETKHARQIFQAMRPVFTDLAQDIQRSIGYYQSLNKDASLTRLIGVGSTFRLPGLRKYLKQQLSMDVYRIEQFKKVTREGEGSAPFEDASLNLVTAYGLGLQGLGLNAVGGNLMPVSVLRKSMWKEKVGWFGLAAGVAALAGGIMFVRPVRDHFAVTGRVPDPVIQQAISRANELKAQAEQAGVTKTDEPDFAAANMVALLEKRGIYTMIAADLNQMFAAADTRAKTWAADVATPGQPPTPVLGPALDMVRFTTDYAPPASADPYAAMSGGGGRMEVMGSASAEVAEPEAVRAHPRIKCVLDMTTSQPEPRRFIKDTVDAWLRANVKRDGIPYTIVFSEPTFEMTELRRIADAAPTGEVGEGGSPGMRFDRHGEAPRGYDRSKFGPEVGSGAAGPSAEDQSAAKSAAAAMEELNKSSPLEPPKDAPVAQPTAKIKVTWWAAFIPAPPADGSAGAQPGGGS